MRDRLYHALRIVWFILSGVILLVLFVPFLVPEHVLAQGIPECQSRAQHGVECPFCGMTSSFYAISRADFDGAMLRNAFSIYLYLLFLANTVLFVAVLLKKGTAGGMARYPLSESHEA